MLLAMKLTVEEVKGRIWRKVKNGGNRKNGGK